MLRIHRPRSLSNRLARVALVIVLAASAGAAFGARTFPQNSRQVKITDVSDNEIVADGDTLRLGPGVLIFTTTNTTVVRSMLTAPVIARIQLDLNGDVRRIWILSHDEILVRPWWDFWHRSQPQGDPTQPAATNQ